MNTSDGEFPSAALQLTVEPDEKEREKNIARRETGERDDIMGG